MIDKDYMQVNGLKKEPFSGSHFGMRYYLYTDGDKSRFTACVYPEPWSFSDTPADQKICSTFPLSDEGMDEAVTWLAKMYNEKKADWQSASKNMMQIVNSASSPV